MLKTDFLVVGAGIAGASVAARLAETHSVIVCDMEERAGYHTTGRSAASYEPNYGPPPMLALTRASAHFFHEPPQGFADAPLLIHRDSIFLEARGQEQHTSKLLAQASALDEISIAETQSRFPILRENYATRAFLDRHTADMDVDLIHRGFIKMARSHGAQFLLSAPVNGIEKQGTDWLARAGEHTIRTQTIVNAAGAWGDVVAGLANVQPIGLVPKRRSIGVIPISRDDHWQDWPMVTDVGETWYAKPQSGKMIVSSADATPVEPHDAYADDMAIAEGVERLMTATTLEVDRLDHSWGGLRTFASDGNPVVGFDPHTEGFFWLVGQGGYGIQSCPALSVAAADMARGHYVNKNILDLGLDVPEIKPERFRR
jgi:D-arginine dehydrogenase